MATGTASTTPWWWTCRSAEADLWEARLWEARPRADRTFQAATTASARGRASHKYGFILSGADLWEVRLWLARLWEARPRVTRPLPRPGAGLPQKRCTCDAGRMPCGRRDLAPKESPGHRGYRPAAASHKFKSRSHPNAGRAQRARPDQRALGWQRCTGPSAVLPAHDARRDHGSRPAKLICPHLSRKAI